VHPPNRDSYGYGYALAMMMAGRAPLSSGANQNRVFIDLTDDNEPTDSPVSNCLLIVSIRVNFPQTVPFQARNFSTNPWPHYSLFCAVAKGVERC
jgi:hypothetical protein